MKNLIVWITGAALLIMSGCIHKVDIASEETQVNTVIDQVIEVMETENMELFSKIFAHDADMVIFGTDASERVVGYDALKAVMEEQFAATENSSLSVRDRTIKVHDSGEVAWFSEIIDWDMVFQGQAVKLEGMRGTGVLVKQNNSWVVVQLHYSVPAEG